MNPLNTMKTLFNGSALFFSLALLLATGCALFQTAAPLAVPAATCAILDKAPDALPYLTSLESAVRKFSAGNDLDAASLGNALVAVPIEGVKPYIVSGAYSIVVVAYGGLVEKYATDPAREPKLREALIAIANGLANGISQCGPPPASSVRLKAAPNVISEKHLDKLSKAIRQSLKSH